MILPEQIIWVIPGLFYLLDNFVTLQTSQFLFFQDSTYRWRSKLDVFPFTWKSKSLYWLNPLTPYTCAFKLNWSYTDAQAFQKVGESRILLWTHSAKCLTLTGTLSFILLFLVGPLITHFDSLTDAILIITPIHILLVFCTGAILAKKKDQAYVWKVIFELILCPGYLPNISRRYTIDVNLQNTNGIAVAQQLMSSEDAKELFDRINEIVSEQSASDLEHPK